MNTKVKHKSKKKSKRKSAKHQKQIERQFRNQKNKDEFLTIAYEIVKIIKHHFPDILEKLKAVPDPRQGRHYKIEEIVFAGVAVFLFKFGSRNAMENHSNKKIFKSNYEKAFGHRLPKPDTVATVFKAMSPIELENLKESLVKELIERKVFDKKRIDGKIIVAVDGTGIVTFDSQHCDQCLEKTSKKTGKKTYFHNVLEAKIVTNNGFSVSLCTEWVENPGVEYKKQDCELKAFTRLAVKLKKAFPRLNICLCADGLYPNKTFFNKCKEYGWSYIVTLKDGNLKNFWKKVQKAKKQFDENAFHEGQTYIEQHFQWTNNIYFNGFLHSWIELEEEKVSLQDIYQYDRFVYITNITITKDNARLICQTGRLRWKIEKQGFDQQKNHGYKICHKYCRKSYTGLKNYYQCCQIAHMINQLLELSKNFQAILTQKTTIAFIWFCIKAFMTFGNVDSSIINTIMTHRYQIQYIE